MATRKQVEAAAAEVGLHVAYYNPGDGARWKITARPLDYFATSDHDVLWRYAGPASVVMYWISGYAAGVRGRA